MEYELDGIIGIDKLDLYYEAHCADLDGEGFLYSVYFQDELTDEKFQEVNNAITEFANQYDENDVYIGDIDVSRVEDKTSVYLDVGNVDPDDADIAITGILKVLNNVTGIKSVIINEW